jgi:hypothetical protein
MEISDTETLELTPEQIDLLRHEADFVFDPKDEHPFAFQLGYAVGYCWIGCRSCDENITGDIMFAYHRLKSVVRFRCIPYDTMNALARDFGENNVLSLLQEAGLNQSTELVSKYTDDSEFLSGFCHGIDDGELLS